eukprot:1762842-Pyramimonas_sp.AAC.1
MDALTELLDSTDLSAAKIIQAPWVGSAGNPRSSFMFRYAPTPPASENDMNAIISGSNRQIVNPRLAVDWRCRTNLLAQVTS